MKRKLVIFVLLVSLLSLWAQAAPQLSHVTDEAGLLTDGQAEALEGQFATTSDEVDCGIYVVTVLTYTDFGYDIEAVGEAFIDQYDLGDGFGGNSILLLLSLEDGEYALCVRGDAADRAFSGSDLDLLKESVLPYLSEGAWFDAFAAYYSICGSMFEQVSYETYETQSGERDYSSIWIAIAVSFVIALIVVMILKSGMKNVKLKTEAGAYVTGSLNLTGRTDRYTHTTTSRVRVQSSSSSKGSSRSGKF